MLTLSIYDNLLGFSLVYFLTQIMRVIDGLYHLQLDIIFSKTLDSNHVFFLPSFNRKLVAVNISAVQRTFIAILNMFAKRIYVRLK